MSVRWLPRELGMVITCNGTTLSTDVTNCRCGPDKQPAQYQTANIMAGNTRAWMKKEGWGRGLRKGRKRCDLCPTHLKLEQELFAKEQADREAEKKRRDELKKAKFSAAPSPKKPRKRKGSASSSSPSAECAPVPA